jgi:hypothetical protein
MKKLALSLFCALSMLVLGGSAYAQAVHVRITVPFDFTVNNKTLPAGQYEVLSAGQINNPSLLEIRRSGGPLEAFVNASDLRSSDTSSQTKLVFEQHGNVYFLSQLWTEGSRAGWEFAKTRTEMREAMTTTGQQVTVASKLAK